MQEDGRNLAVVPAEKNTTPNPENKQAQMSLGGVKSQSSKENIWGSM
jgi:hypothetical protein